MLRGRSQRGVARSGQRDLYRLVGLSRRVIDDAEVIALLKAFLTIAENHEPFDQQRLMWLVVIHTTFVISGVLMACMDWLASKTKHH